jgi:hypothetical protein
MDTGITQKINFGLRSIGSNDTDGLGFSRILDGGFYDNENKCVDGIFRSENTFSGISITFTDQQAFLESTTLSRTISTTNATVTTSSRREKNYNICDRQVYRYQLLCDSGCIYFQQSPMIRSFTCDATTITISMNDVFIKGNIYPINLYHINGFPGVLKDVCLPLINFKEDFPFQVNEPVVNPMVIDVVEEFTINTNYSIEPSTCSCPSKAKLPALIKIGSAFGLGELISTISISLMNLFS